MGLDANSVIWLGVNEDSVSEALGNLPDEMRDALDNVGEIELEGLTFREFHHADEPVGFGVEILDHGWRTGTINFNPSDLTQRVQDLMPKVTKAFQAMNINAEPKVWLGTHL